MAKPKNEFNKQEDQIHKRRLLLNKIIKEQGYRSIVQLQDALREHGVSADRKTLYDDLRFIGGLDEEKYDNLADEIIDDWKKYMADVKNVIDSTNNDEVKVKAIRLYFSISKDVIKLANTLNVKETKKPVDRFEPRKYAKSIRIEEDGEVGNQESR